MFLFVCIHSVVDTAWFADHSLFLIFLSALCLQLAGSIPGVDASAIQDALKKGDKKDEDKKE